MTLCVAAGAARAQPAPPSVRFTYVRGPGAEACPDEAGMRAAVARLLGYEPFDETAARTVDCRAAKVGRTLEVTISVTDAGGAVVGERLLTSRDWECGELTSASALAIAMAIDPLRSLSPSTEPRATPLPAPPLLAPSATLEIADPARRFAALVLAVFPARAATATPAVDAESPPLVRTFVEPPAPRTRTVDFHVGLGGLATIGGAVPVVPGAAVEAGVRDGRFSLALGLHTSVPEAVTDLGGRVEVATYAGAAVMCVHAGRLSICWVTGAGWLRAQGRGYDQDFTTNSFTSTVGPRVAWEFPVGGRVSVRAHAELANAIMGAALRVQVADTFQEIWRTPTITGTFGLTAVGRFQ